MPVNSQLLSGLMGRNYVAQPDAAELQDNYLSLQVKRNALRRQQESDRALAEFQKNPQGADLRRLATTNPQVAATVAGIDNLAADNKRAQVTQDNGIIAAVALKKKADEAEAKRLKEEAEAKEKQRHAQAAIFIHENPTPEALPALKANGLLTDEEIAQFSQVDPAKYKQQARALMAANMTPTELEAYDTKQSTIANQQSEIKERDAKAALEADKKKEQADAFAVYWEQNGKGKTPSTLDFLRFKQLPTEKERIDDERQAQQLLETKRHNEIQEGIAAQREHRESAVTAATYGAGVPQAVKGLPPATQRQASTAAQKATDAYLKGQAVADNMQAMIDLARSGNKAAGSNLPLVGVETINAINGIKRINSAEISQYQGAGSLLDKIQGRIGSLTVGQPIPADVLKDIESLHTTLRQNGDKAYADELGGINHTYGANFEPYKRSGASAPKTINVVSPKGVPGTIPAEDWADAEKEGYRKR